MFDTMTLTKIVASLCATLLVYLLAGWVADLTYSSGGGHGGHGDDHAKMGYVIETDEGHGDSAAEEGPDFATLLASADVEKGAKIFKKCAACHKLEAGANGTGPTLFGVVNRAVGSVSGFEYSGALTAVADTWDADSLNGFLEKPSKYAPGTKMSFSGLKKIPDRANLIAYLATVK